MTYLPRHKSMPAPFAAEPTPIVLTARERDLFVIVPVLMTVAGMFLFFACVCGVI